jgi:menaquinone-dependent protoporphyrinogen IX oxidase
MNKRTFIKSGLLGLGAVLLSKKSSALEYYPRPSEKRWAVLYGTWCGSARDAAVWISEGMNGIANVFDVHENPDLLNFDHIVVGGSIRWGKFSPELQQYLEKNNGLIKSRVRGYFAVCGNMMKPVMQETSVNLIDNQLAKICGVTNIPSKVFLGRITFGLIDSEARKQIESFQLQEYDLLKRSECMAFGKEVLTALPGKK